MFDIFYLLTITWRFFQSFDYQSGSRWNDINLCLTILNSQFNGYPQPFPVLRITVKLTIQNRQAKVDVVPS